MYKVYYSKIWHMTHNNIQLLGYKKMKLRELQLIQLEAMKQIHAICVKKHIQYYIIAGTLLGAIRHGGYIPWDDDIDIAMMRNDYETFKSVFSQEIDNQKYFLQNYTTDKYFQPALQRVCIKNTIQDLPTEYHLHNCKNTFIDIFPLDNAPNEIKLRLHQAKRLAHIDRLINLKLYHIYEKDNWLSTFVKQITSFCLSAIPLTILRVARVKEMTRYNHIPTQCVASTVSKYGYTKQLMDRSIYGKPVLINFEGVKLYGPNQADNYLLHLYGRDYMQEPPIEKRELPYDVYIKV